MEAGNVIAFPAAQGRAAEVQYTVLFSHSAERFGFKIFGVGDDEEDREAVARAFEKAAKMLRNREDR